MPFSLLHVIDFTFLREPKRNKKQTNKTQTVFIRELAPGLLTSVQFSPSGDREEEILFSLLMWINSSIPVSEDVIRQEPG